MKRESFFASNSEQEFDSPGWGQFLSLMLGRLTHWGNPPSEVKEPAIRRIGVTRRPGKTRAWTLWSILPNPARQGDGVGPLSPLEEGSRVRFSVEDGNHFCSESCRDGGQEDG